MKMGKRLTREMKILLTNNGYEPDAFLWTKMTKTAIEFVSKRTGKTVILERY